MMICEFFVVVSIVHSLLPFTCYDGGGAGGKWVSG